MGCYGIGVGRLMSSIMEVYHDKFGPVWPISVSPWQVHLNGLKLSDGKTREAADKLYADLQAAGLEVLFDDRDQRPGFQFADADLLGIPFRLIVSARNLEAGEVEWKRRDTDEKGTMPLGEAAETVRQWVDEEMAKIQAKADAY
jgi:prolyl-tRNA synthetase